MAGTRRLIAAGMAASLAVAGMWLPWFRSGESARSSFAAFRAAQLLGIEWITPLRILWFLLPVVLLLALLSLAARYPITGLGLLIGLGLILALGGASFVFLIGPEIGSAAAAIAGACTIVLAVAALGPRRSRHAG
jgi:hypothetical protein